MIKKREYDQKIPQSQTTDNTASMFRRFSGHALGVLLN